MITPVKQTNNETDAGKINYLRKEIKVFTDRYLSAVKRAFRKSDLIIAENLIMMGYHEGKREICVKRKTNIIQKIFLEIKKERVMATIPAIVRDEIKEQAKAYMSAIKGDDLTDEDIMIAENLIIFGYLLAKDEQSGSYLNYTGKVKNENITEKNTKAIISAEWN
jgi:hypothetical protein